MYGELGSLYKRHKMYLIALDYYKREMAVSWEL
jgi:hypothetical protein